MKKNILLSLSIYVLSTLASAAPIDIQERGSLCSQAILNIDLQNTKQSKFDNAFSICLGNYIQIKTISPVGNEERAVEYFREIFSSLGFANKVFKVKNLGDTPQEFRTNIIATLPKNRSETFDWSAASDNKSIILLNHMDVVDAHPEQWERPELAWSGEVASSVEEPNRNFIWGRGSLDMKGIGITQLINMWILKNSDQDLKRDIHFLAVADEESHGSGAIGAIQQMNEGGDLLALSNASMVLNEGGGGIKDVLKKGRNLFLFSVEEKGGAWLEMNHSNPLKLLQDLYRAKILNISSFLKTSDILVEQTECSLQKVTTPNRKVNVVASKLHLEMKCKSDVITETLIRSAFTNKFKTVKANIVKMDSGSWKVTIETNSSSHGSTGINESALDSLSVGLYRLRMLELTKTKKKPSFFRYIKSEATSKLISELGRSKFIIKVLNKLTWIRAIRNILLKEVESSFGIDGLFRTTCEFTAFDSDPGKASALVDCRLLHTAFKKKHKINHASSFIDELHSWIKDVDLSISLQTGWDVSQSTIRSKDYKTISKAIRETSLPGERNALVPYLFPAGTDSTWFRNPTSAGNFELSPIPSYGFFPLFVSEELLASFHGSNERFPVDQVGPTISRYIYVLESLLKY